MAIPAFILHQGRKLPYVPNCWFIMGAKASSLSDDNLAANLNVLGLKTSETPQRPTGGGSTAGGVFSGGVVPDGSLDTAMPPGGFSGGSVDADISWDRVAQKPGPNGGRPVWNTGQTHGFFFGKLPKQKLLNQVLGKGATTAPVFSTDIASPHHTVALRPDVLVVEPAPGHDLDEVVALAQAHGMARDPLRTLTGKLVFNLAGGKEDVFAVKHILEGQAAVAGVHYEMIPGASPLCSGPPNDPLFAQEWHLKRIQWDKGDAVCGRSTVIAVMDEGCDLTHPDLAFASPGINLATMKPDGSPTGSHGTACGGIAAAVTDNAQGVAGVASRASILPLAFTYWSDVEFAAGLRYAVTQGADVVSMSFGVYDHWNYWNYALIDPEIVFASMRNVFLVAASGNENDGKRNRYPAKHPLVFCVGGTNRDDQRKRPKDGSAEPYWGACYGLETYQGLTVGLDVAAPCLEIATTDIRGGGGYDAGDYFPRFNGTSSATPQVAGLAALIKSVLPDAANTLVAKIIRSTADRVGPYTYTWRPEFPDAPWTHEVGHGRINVRNALRMARRHACAPACCCGGTDGGRGDVVAFSASGETHVSKGDAALLRFGKLWANQPADVWLNNAFTAPAAGLYVFDWTFVKDSYYHGGTQDDVHVYLLINGSQKVGDAWSGEGDGRRGTGAWHVVLPLAAGDKVEAFVTSDSGANRHVAAFTLSGYKL